MKDEMFEELLASVQEGADILRGKAPASRTFVMNGPEIKGLRSRYHLSQSQFAALLGISAATLRNWEQGRRKPEGPARVLLQVAARHPEALFDNIPQESALKDSPGVDQRRSGKVTNQKPQGSR